MNRLKSKVARVGHSAGFLFRRLRACWIVSRASIRRLYLSELSTMAVESGSDKGPNAHGYSEVYGEYLHSFRGAAITMLEIGLLMHRVQARQGRSGVYSDAPSLRLWRRYFPRAKLIGFDVADFSSVEIENCVILQGDQSRHDDLEQIGAHCPDGLDVAIDDALHASRHQQVTLASVFPMLKPGGLYFIEDLHYQPPETEEEGVPLTIDILHRLVSSTAGGNSPSAAISDAEWRYLSENVESIRFFDSIRIGSRRGSTDALAVVSKKRGPLS